MNLSLPKNKQLKPHDLYGEAPKPKISMEELEGVRRRIGPEAIPVDLEKLRKQRRRD